MRTKSILLLILFMAKINFAQSTVNSTSSEKNHRQGISLDGSGWRVWLDEIAEWKNDSLYAPGEVPALNKLLVNPPTCGWNLLEKQGVDCSIPATIEEIFSKGINSWRYHGVSWFGKTVKIPAGWQGKTVRLKVGKARLRVELFVNGMLAGYDLCCETPLDFDISKYLKYGINNHIAFRLTNPGGQRGWEDFPGIKWGKYELPASHDFTGLDDVRLVESPSVFMADVFVKNRLPVGARNIEVQVTVRNGSAQYVARTVTVKVNGTSASARRDVRLAPGDNLVAFPLTVAEAKLWDINNPVLYTCSVVLSGKNPDQTDRMTQRFGFRVSEVKPATDGQHHFYWNGSRIRHRSAIDWGYYALSGFYATPEMARRNIESARAVGHNGLNFHRRIGEARVFEYADKLGLYIYEEPGGFHAGGQGYEIRDNTLVSKLMAEKCRRMVIRDRNHPSLMMYSLCNEDNKFPPFREQMLKVIHKLDPTRLVINSSGDNDGGRMPKVNMCHMRPYESDIRTDYTDTHGAFTDAKDFSEGDFYSHDKYYPNQVSYWGEVRCYTGPANWLSIGTAVLPDNRPGYDRNIYAPMAAKLQDFFTRCRLSETGSKVIHTSADISRQAGRSLMYIDGRLGQLTMAHNEADGYAINGWSPGPQLPDAWDSAICDEMRIVKGPSADMAYWNRDLQVAIFRANGKYFQPGDTARFEISIINEKRIAAGDYILKMIVTTGDGSPTDFGQSVPVKIQGGDVYAQKIPMVSVILKPEWRAGHITLRGMLLDTQGKTVADGAEQVMLQNRASFAKGLAGTAIAVTDWPAAETALKEARTATVSADSAAVILAGTPTVDSAKLLALAKAGKILVIKFDSIWAKRLYDQGLLSEPVTQWGGQQSPGWNGNGWGYIDHFVGDQAVPSKTIIGTRTWETFGDPVGFWPFASRYKQAAYGAYMARNDKLLVLIGAIDYGKGKIILAPSYPVDANRAFNDMLFFNMINKASRKEW
jgi:beta-galactosidase